MALLYCLVVFFKFVYFVQSLGFFKCVNDFYKVICFGHIKNGLSLVFRLCVSHAGLSFV